MIPRNYSITGYIMMLTIMSLPTCAHSITNAERVLSSTSTSAHYSDESPWELDLSNWSQETQVPVGILIDGDNLQKPTARLDEAGALHAIHSPPQYHSHAIASRAMFDLVCDENPDYQWRVVRGVINIVPRQMDKDYLRPLNTMVVGFKMREFSFRSALNGLFRQANMPLQASGVVTGSLSHFRSPTPIDFVCDNVTVLECINILATQSKHSWQIAYRHDIQSFYIDSSGDIFFTPTKKQH